MLRTVAIQLDKPRRLKYDLNAFALLKEQHGINLFESDDKRLQDPAAVRAILWAGLVHEDPAVTIGAVGSFVDLGNLREVSEKVAEAMMASQRRAVEGEEDAAPFVAPLTVTGETSTS